MKPIYLLPFAALAMLASCTEPPPVSAERQFVEAVATALGGADAVKAVDTLTMSAAGRMPNLGQDLTPESVTMEFTISDYRRTVDLANRRSRTELTRTPLFDYFRGPDPMRLVSGIDGDVAYDVGPDGEARRMHDIAAADRQSAYYHHPLPLLQVALADVTAVDNVRTDGAQTLADITTATNQTFTLAVDTATHRPSLIRSTDHHSYLRDVTRETVLSDYEASGPLTLPTAIRQSLDEFLVFELELSAQDINPTINDISAPPTARSAAPISGTPPTNVTAERLADGVWLLAGQSHHSVLLEFDDHLKLIEAPNENRTLAVVAKSKELVPDKPLTHVINTHHHFDHSGGLRAATSAGFTIVTHAANEAFFRRMAEQPSALVPDVLSRAPRPIEIEVVDDKRVYEDTSMALELYHVVDSPHSSSILMGYLPRQRLLIEADLYTPGRSTPQRFAPNLLDNIERHGLEIDRVVPIHGGVFGFEELVAAVAALRD